MLIIFPYTADQIYVPGSPQKADLIVIAAGSPDRFVYGLELFKQGYASKILVSGTDQFTDYWLRDQFDILDQSVTNSVLQLVSYSTIEDAINTNQFISDQNFSSILLVTSPYHSYRANWVFRHVLPRSIKIIPATVPEEDCPWSNDLAKKRGTPQYRIFRKEQVKFLLYYLLYSWHKF